jgi:hypothetical protein
MEDIFYTLAGFEDPVYIHQTTENNVTTREVRGLTEALKHELELAVSSIILIFCEALRLRSLYNADHAALQGPDYVTPLPSRLWILLHSWGKLSEHVLRMRKRRTMTLDSALPQKPEFLAHDFPTMTLDDLIGPAGELLLCKLDVYEIIKPDHLERRSKERGARTNLTEPNL